MSQDTERREWERLRRLGWEPTTPPPQVCDGPVTPQTPAPIRSQDTERPSGRLPERLTDEQVDRITRYNDCNVDGGLAAILAREVQASRKLVAAARVLATASEAEMIRLTGMAYPNGGFQCPADPCPYCTAQDEFTIAVMDYEDGA